MPLDPQVAEILKARASSGASPAGSVSPQVARASRAAAPREQGPEVAHVEDRIIPTPAGDVPVRLYRPDATHPLPALIWMHGGGWIVGTLDTTDATCRHMASLAGIAVLSVDYSLSPEAKFPQALDECHGVACWLAEHGPELGIDPARIAVGGASAGGNLAAAAALKARDEGGPKLAMQLLVYPVVDFEADSESYRAFSHGYGLDAESMDHSASSYLRDLADARNPYAAPMLAEDLSGLPPAHVITAEYDPLRDTGEAYARRLQQAGVPTTYTRYEGMVHAFFGFPINISKTRAALEEAAAVLKERLLAGV